MGEGWAPVEEGLWRRGVAALVTSCLAWGRSGSPNRKDKTGERLRCTGLKHMSLCCLWGLTWFILISFGKTLYILYHDNSIIHLDRRCHPCWIWNPRYAELEVYLRTNSNLSREVVCILLRNRHPDNSREPKPSDVCLVMGQTRSSLQGFRSHELALYQRCHDIL